MTPCGPTASKMYVKFLARRLYTALYLSVPQTEGGGVGDTLKAVVKRAKSTEP